MISRKGYKRDWYPQLPVRAAEISPPAVGLSEHNTRLLANQVRVSGGYTHAPGLIGENGRMVAQRLQAVLR